MCKNIWKTTPYMRDMMMKHSRFFAVTFEGNMFSETRPVTQKAWYLFNVDQADIIKSIARR